MKIYAKTQETLKELASSKPSDSVTREPNDTATSDKNKLDLCADSLNSKSKYLSRNEQSDTERMSNIPDRPYRVSCERNVNQSQNFHRSSAHGKKGSGKFYANEFEQKTDSVKRNNRSYYGERKFEPSYGREKAGTENDVFDSETSFSERDEHYLRKSESKHSHKKKNSSAYDDGLEHEASYSRESSYRSYNHKERQSKQRPESRRFTESDDDNEWKLKYSPERYHVKPDSNSRKHKSNSARPISDRSLDRAHSSKHERYSNKKHLDYVDDNYSQRDKEFSKRSDRSTKESRRDGMSDYYSELVTKLSKKFEPKTLRFD